MRKRVRETYILTNGKNRRVFKECADGTYRVDSITWKHMMKARHGTNVRTPIRNRLVTRAEADKLIAYWQSKGYNAIEVHRVMEY